MESIALDKTNVRKYKVVKIVKNTNEEFLNKNVFPLNNLKKYRKKKCFPNYPKEKTIGLAMQI